MADQKAILHLALERAQDSEDFRAFAKGLLSEQSKGRTIFSKAAAVLKAAPEGSLDSCREMLRKIERLGSGGGARFHGVKVEQLQRLVFLLFGEKKDLLSLRAFGDFDRKDLLGYLEICHRCFLIAQMERPDEARTVKAPTATAKRESALNDLLAQWQAKQKEEK